MASHVVVIDSAARRHQIKTSPNKGLSEVLEEACTKLSLNSSQYGLKHNNKQIDLSRTIRLSGLSSGAKLELVQLSKSAGVVSVALQLPESEAQGLLNARLTDKFPSTTTLWLVLRKFEAGVAGGAPARNLTAKAAPSTASGAGRLYYEQPVVQIMGRELGSLRDLQKSLAQLGFNSGSALLRLSFRSTQMPLEEAMAEIQGYFDSVDSQMPAASIQRPALPAQTPGDATTHSETEQKEQPLPTVLGTEVVTETPTSDSSILHATKQALPSSDESSPVVSGTRQVAVFAPPTASTPSAASQAYRETDFVPTVEHAQLHQKMLQQSTLNKRLPTDAELESQAAAKKAEWAAVQEVEVKIRFPDQSAVSTKFSQLDTAADLYSFARDCLSPELASESFVLKNPGVRGKGEAIPNDTKTRLIGDIHLRGRVLVIFGWDEQKASLAARGAKQILKAELRSHAQQPKAPEIPDLVDDNNDKGVRVDTGKGQSTSGSGGDDSKGKKMPKWLKGLAKK